MVIINFSNVNDGYHTQTNLKKFVKCESNDLILLLQNFSFHQHLKTLRCGAQKDFSKLLAEAFEPWVLDMAIFSRI
jgi:hypothetical protein